MIADKSLLGLWERGWGMPPFRRALLILSAFVPGVPVESLARLTIGQRDARLLQIKAIHFGNRIESIADCPQCNESLEFDVLASDLAQDFQESPKTVEVQVDDLNLVCELPTTEHLERCFQSRRSSDGVSAAQSHCSLIETCISRVGRDGAEAGDFQLTPEISQAVESAIRKADSLAQIDFQLECVECSHAWSATFDIATHLWSEIQSYCQRLVCDVHTLASRYGWQESTILELSPWRRQVYLELARQ